MDKDIDVTAQLAQWSQSLMAIARTGLSLSDSPYDVERYRELLKLSADMAATINANAQLNPAMATRLEATWHHQLETGFKGYVTPNVSVGAIVFNHQDEILLVYSALQDCWIFPGGNADVGYTAAEIARKEVKEETGLDVTPLDLMGIDDSFRQGFNLNVHLYSVHFYCRLDGGELNSQTSEISEAGFFKRGNLPQSMMPEGEPTWVKRAFDLHLGVCRQPYFDL